MVKLNGQSDESLFRAYIEEGDLSSVEMLIDRHWTSTYRIAYRLLGDPHAAEDAAQETFVKLLASSGRYNQNRSFLPGSM